MKPNSGKEADVIKSYKLFKIRFRNKFDIHEIGET